jgi:signal transduction histidine kinase
MFDRRPKWWRWSFDRERTYLKATANNASKERPPAGSADAPDRQGQRERVRRSRVRAVTAVAIVLLAVLGLALVAGWASVRATRHQRLAEEAQQAGRAELWRAYLSEARAARLGTALDRRQASWRAITSAIPIQTSAELRDEAVAALALGDFSLEHAWPLSAEVATQAFDKGFHHYAIGFTNGDILLRRISDNAELRWLHPEDGSVPREQGAVIGLEFSPEGDQLAARYEKGGAAVWSLATGRTIFREAMDKPRSPLSRPRFTPDGRLLLCLTTVPTPGVAMFDLARGERVAHFPQFPPWSHVAPRPHATMFAVNTVTNAVLLFDWSTGRTVQSLPFPGAIERMAWSPDGQYLALGGTTVDVHLWDLATGQKRLLTGHTADVRHLAFDSQGQRLASASSDATSRIWEVPSGRLLGVTDRGFAEQFGAEGRLALSRFKGAVEIWVWRPSTVHRVLIGPGPTESPTWPMDFSSDGRWIASVVAERGLALWDLDGPSTPRWLDLPGARLLGFLPPSGTADASHPPPIYLTRPRRVWERRLSIPSIEEAAAATNGTTPTAAPPKSTAAAVANAPANAMAAPTLQGSVSLPLPAGFDPHWIALSRDGRSMALGSMLDGQTYVVDRMAPEKRTWLRGLRHLTPGEAQSPAATLGGGGTLALSRDGRWAACGFNYPRGTKIWNAQSGDPVTNLSSDNAIVDFSAQAEHLIAGSRSAFQLFATADWREIWRVPREGALFSPGPCAFSPDGTQVAVAKSRQTAVILETATGRELVSLLAPRPATIKVFRWSGDGRTLALGTAENLVHVWDMAVLQSNLVAIGLGSLGAPPSRVPAPVFATPGAGIAGALGLALAAAGVITFIALLALHRHRRLVEDFARSETLAECAERELRIEREVGQLKSNFVSMVSHEFRTPLGVIRAAGESLTRYFGRLSDPQRAELLGDIHKSAQRMNELMEEVLLLGRVESGRMECRPAPVDLPALVRRVMAEVSKSMHDRCPIEYRNQTPSINAASWQLDEGLVVIILNNLLTNAVKYSKAGQPVWLVSRQEGQQVILEVRDEGIGIPPADVPELFKSFHRGRNVGEIPGTGLGLVIVKRCVELHGGTISLVSHEGVGTTFTVRLPAHG